MIPIALFKKFLSKQFIASVEAYVKHVTPWAGPFWAQGG